MELLVSLKNMNLLEKLYPYEIDGIVFGSKFSNLYHYSYDEIKEICLKCDEHNLKKYISIDSFINENDIDALKEYLKFISTLFVDGIYFNDLAVIEVAKIYGISHKLIYDSSTLSTNINDIGFYIKRGMGVVLARELTLQEISEIVKEYPYRLDMQIFGHLRMSYSKRKFLTNYFNEIKKEVNFLNADNFTLEEESRNYKLPIIETEYGTSIYTDYIFLMYEEFPYLSKILRRGIINSEFMDDDLLFDLLKDIKRVNIDNAEFLTNAYTNIHYKDNFSNGYLYQKTVDKKQDDE